MDGTYFFERKIRAQWVEMISRICLQMKIVFCFENCSDLLQCLRFFKFNSEGREFANILRSLEQFIRTFKGQYVQFLKQNIFFNLLYTYVKEYNGKIRIPIGTKNWKVDPYRSKLEKIKTQGVEFLLAMMHLVTLITIWKAISNSNQNS